MITIALTNEDAAFLSEQLMSRSLQVENELVHTDKRALQADIARDLERLNSLRDRLTHAIDLEEAALSV